MKRLEFVNCESRRVFIHLELAEYPYKTYGQSGNQKKRSASSYFKRVNYLMTPNFVSCLSLQNFLFQLMPTSTGDCKSSSHSFGPIAPRAMLYLERSRPHLFVSITSIFTLQPGNRDEPRTSCTESKFKLTISIETK